MDRTSSQFPENTPVAEVKATGYSVVITFARKKEIWQIPISVDVIPQHPSYNGEEILLHFSGIGNAHIEAERCAANQIKIKVVKDAV
jgi:hypothetical protein